MNCDQARSLLGWFYDGELSPADRKLVADHVDHCLDCAGELTALAELDRASRQLVALEPAPKLWDQIVRRLSAEQGMRKKVARRRFLLAACALVTSAACLALTYGLRRQGSGSGSEVVAKPPGPPDPIGVNLALLDPEDRRLAEAQEVCASAECMAPLGMGGPPVKIVLQDKAVFLCCQECAQWAKKHPSETVAKLHTLEHRREGLNKDP
jgi:hypothetical protein